MWGNGLAATKTTRVALRRTRAGSRKGPGGSCQKKPLGASTLPRGAPKVLRGSPWPFIRPTPQESTLWGQQEDIELRSGVTLNVNAATEAICKAILARCTRCENQRVCRGWGADVVATSSPPA